MNTIYFVSITNYEGNYITLYLLENNIVFNLDHEHLINTRPVLRFKYYTFLKFKHTYSIL